MSIKNIQIDPPTCYVCAKESGHYGRSINTPAVGFFRNTSWDGADNWLEPVCAYHRDQCEQTFVHIDLGWEEWTVHSVMQA